MSWKSKPILVFDTETTGLSAVADRIIEFAWVSYECGIHGEGSTLIGAPVQLSEFITKLTGIKQEDLIGQPSFSDFVPKLEELLLQHPILCGYNVIGFDRHFLISEFARSSGIHLIGTLMKRPWIDPFIWIKHFQKYEKGKKLFQVAERLGIKVEDSHRALPDAKTCTAIMEHYLPKMPSNLNEALDLQNKWAQEADSNYAEWKSKREEIEVGEES